MSLIYALKTAGKKEKIRNLSAFSLCLMYEFTSHNCNSAVLLAANNIPSIYTLTTDTSISASHDNPKLWKISRNEPNTECWQYDLRATLHLSAVTHFK